MKFGMKENYIWETLIIFHQMWGVGRIALGVLQKFWQWNSSPYLQRRPTRTPRLWWFDSDLVFSYTLHFIKSSLFLFYSYPESKADWNEMNDYFHILLRNHQEVHRFGENMKLYDFGETVWVQLGQWFKVVITGKLVNQQLLTINYPPNLKPASASATTEYQTFSHFLLLHRLKRCEK